MAEGTSVGGVYLDLIVRDTVDKQVSDLSNKAAASAKKSFSSIETTISSVVNKAIGKFAKLGDTIANGPARAVERAAGNMQNSTQKAFQSVSNSAASCGKKVESSIDKSFNKSVAHAKSKVMELERALESVNSRLNAFAGMGITPTNSKEANALVAEQESLYKRLAAAKQRLSIENQAAAQKAAQAEARAHEQAAARIKNAFSKAFSGIKNKFSTVGKSAGSFGRRLKGIVSSALVFNILSRGLSNMVKYMGTAIGTSQKMQTALANLKGAAATAAAPLWDVLTPALAALANSAATALSYLSQLISFFTGKTVASMSNAAKKIQSTAGTAKKAMASLAGFDEIQKLDSNNSSGGSGGAAEVQPNFDFQGQSSFFDSVMESIKAGQWGQVGTLVAQKLNDGLAAIQWPDIQEKAKTWTQNLVDTINGFVGDLDWDGIGRFIGNGLNSWMLIIDTFFQGVDWTSLGSGLGNGLNDLISTIDWPMLGRILTDKFRAMFERLHGFLQTFDFTAFGSSLAAMFNAAFGNINWTQLAEDVSKGITGLLEGATAFVGDLDWVGLGTTIYDYIIAIDWEGMIDGLLELLATLATGMLISLGAGLLQAFQDLGETISGYFTDVGENGILGFLEGMWNMLCDIGTWLYDHLVKPVIDGVCNALGIHSPSTVFADIGENLITGLFNGISDTWTSIATFFTEAFESLQEKIAEIWENGILPAIKGPINSIIGFVNGLISGICEGVNTIIRAMNKLKWDIPDWIPVLGGKSFGFNLSTISAPKIPMLADGGVITQPTLAMMGEYAGARNNPEIVTPQSVMAETVATVMEDVVASNVAGFEAVVAVLKDILEAILGIEIDGEIISKAYENYQRKMAVVRGG